MNENQTKLCDIFSELSKNKSELNLNTKIKDLNLDSMDTLDLSMQIFNKFNVDIPIENFVSCETIGAVYVEIINSKITATNIQDSA